MLAVAARSSLVCWLGAVSFCSSQQIVAAQLNLLSADLAFHFVCEGKSRGEPEKAIEPFLRASGFRVLNLAEFSADMMSISLTLTSLRWTATGELST